jgi:hypothetical protein
MYSPATCEPAQLRKTLQAKMQLLHRPSPERGGSPMFALSAIDLHALCDSDFAITQFQRINVVKAASDALEQRLIARGGSAVAERRMRSFSDVA